MHVPLTALLTNMKCVIVASIFSPVSPTFTYMYNMHNDSLHFNACTTHCPLHVQMTLALPGVSILQLGVTMDNMTLVALSHKVTVTSWKTLSGD